VTPFGTSVTLLAFLAIAVGWSACRRRHASNSSTVSWTCPSVSEQRVHDAVPPLPGPEHDPPQDALTLEADILKCPLLGDVLDIGVRLKPMRRVLSNRY
jgi:hypothetical protein